MGAQEKMSHKKTLLLNAKNTILRLRENKQNLDFGCLKGPSHRDGSFKHPNCMFSLE